RARRGRGHAGCITLNPMSDALATYLHDHLAGATFAVNLLEALRDKAPAHASFAGGLLQEIEADRAVLEDLTERMGGGASALKDATAWVGEKLSRLKLGRTASGDLGTFESLEMLALGIQGKLSLWKALAVVAASEAALHGIDFGHLAGRAQAQHAQVEQRRLELAPRALGAYRPAA
ncbi:MAG TPA: hypothetical protein VEA38_17120, partial [Terriglobales bacterium]|nr:hypothetical protein [Terriglobales bacterium]